MNGNCGGLWMGAGLYADSTVTRWFVAYDGAWIVNSGTFEVTPLGTEKVGARPGF